jgi:hypothetical protein
MTYLDCFKKASNIRQKEESMDILQIPQTGNTPANSQINLGALLADAIIDWHPWCHRRVETINLLERDMALRRISLDCTPRYIPYISGTSREEHTISPTRIIVPLACREKTAILTTSTYLTIKEIQFPSWKRTKAVSCPRLPYGASFIVNS